MNAPLQTPDWLAHPQLGSEDWWREVRGFGTPLRRTLPDGQVELTFLWRDPAGGPAASQTERVYLDVYSHTPHPSEQLTSMARVDDTDVWYWRTRLADDWRGSYYLMPASRAQKPPAARAELRGWWIALMEANAIADPLNPIAPHSGGWGLPLSAIELPQARLHPAWTQPSPCPPAGQLLEHRWQSDRLRNTRTVWLYRTAAASAARPSQPPPLVILLDGHYWARQMPLYAALDWMTARGDLPPAQYIFIDALSPEQRTAELPCNPSFWRAIQDELLPALSTTHAFSGDPRRTVVAGQSFGGLSALYAGLHWPQRFGRILSQSGSYWWPASGPEGGGWLAQELHKGLCAGHTLDIELEVGCYEPDMINDHRAIHTALQAAGHRVHYREFRGGHDWLCWRHGLLAGLCRLLNNLPEERQP